MICRHLLSTSFARLFFLAILATCVMGVTAAHAEDPGGLVQVRQDFSSDPGWEGVDNRIVGTGCPTIEQNFGWRPTNHTGGPTSGEIGGLFWDTRTPAWYGMKLDRPLTFNDAFSVSGRFSITTPWEPRHGGAYIGFFNSKRQEWRPWNSCAVRVGGLYALDYMTETWRAAGVGNKLWVPPDGKPHVFWFKYEPNVLVAKAWPDPRLANYVKAEKLSEIEILKIARQSEPDLAAEVLYKRLFDAQMAGLVVYEERRGIGWRLRDNPGDLKGRLTLQFDRNRVAVWFVPLFHRNEPLTMDTFGVFNYQLPDPAFPLEAYFSDLVVNDKRIDLSNDPKWQGKGNHVKFVDTDFHSKFDYGYSKTNHAGKSKGEIGGLFWRSEAVDPINGYYADEIGKLTLDDPMSFSGSIAFLNGGTDAGMFFGYFNAKEKMAKIEGAEGAHPANQSMGIGIDGPTRIGYWFSPLVCPTLALTGAAEGPVFVPNGKKHNYTFDYDPKANNNTGRIRMTLDGQEVILNLSPEQRKQGATFDHFGLMNARRGGKYVTVYFDDMTYTARRTKDYKPVFHEQKITEVPYPPGGRLY